MVFCITLPIALGAYSGAVAAYYSGSPRRIVGNDADIIQVDSFAVSSFMSAECAIT